MNPQMITREPLRRDLAEMVDTMARVLDELRRVSARLVCLLRARLDASRSGDLDTLASCFEHEREVLVDFVLAERERVACLTEIGLTLGHRSPSRLRIAELILYLDCAQRDELLDLREALRDVADEVDALVAATHRLQHLRSGRMSLYISAGLPTPDFFAGLISTSHVRGEASAVSDDVVFPLDDGPFVLHALGDHSCGDVTDSVDEDEAPVRTGSGTELTDVLALGDLDLAPELAAALGLDPADVTHRGRDPDRELDVGLDLDLETESDSDERPGAGLSRRWTRRDGR